MAARFLEHGPVARHRLAHDHRRRLLLRVAQHDLVGALEDVARLVARLAAAEIGLLLVGGDVEGLAQLEADPLVLGGVVDAVLADELRVARAVLLVHAHHALRHRHAEARRLAVLELHEHPDLHLLPDAADARAVVIVAALEHELLGHRHAARAEERHLLRLVIGDRRRAPERVEVILEERFLRHLACRGVGFGHPSGESCRLPQFVAHAVDVARHELQLGARVGGAARVGERHPAVQIQRAVRAVELGDVIGFPRQPARQVGELERLRAGARAQQLGHQRRPVAQVGRHAVVDDAPGQTGLDAVADPQYHAVARRQHRRGLDRLGAGGGMGLHHADRPPDVFFQQLGRGEQVEVEVLLDQGERPGLRQAAQLRRLGAHAPAYLAQRKAVRPRLQRHAPRVLHQRQVLVIDCDGHRLLVLQRARHLLHRGMGERARR